MKPSDHPEFFRFPAPEGRSRESTNKQLRAWAKRGWIRLERGGVGVTAPDKLAAIAAEGFDAS